MNEADKADSRGKLSEKWRVFAGGHPLPNEASLAAARSCLDLRGEADDEEAIIIFLISGGGSAMLELPSDDSISLEDLRRANRVLVACGASIAEINKIRRALSRVKGGGLAAMFSRAAQISLIISDVEPGDEKSVASGLTFEGETIDFNGTEFDNRAIRISEKAAAVNHRRADSKSFGKTG